jgi:hypothetical protein
MTETDIQRPAQAPAAETGAAQTLSAFFETYARALSAGDLDGIAACYTTPGLVLGDDNSLPISTLDEVRGAFAGAAEAYRARGLVTARPRLDRVQPLTARLVEADVRWEYLDPAGAAVPGAAYRYLLRLGAAGEPRIQVVIATAGG